MLARANDNSRMRIACCQLDAKTMDTAATVWPALERGVEEAARRGADCCILPEIAYPAYFLQSIERYRRPDIERGERVVGRYSKLAKKHRMWMVAGYVEERGDKLFNSAAIIDASGELVAIARKQFMWDCDADWFAPGDASLVVPTPWGAMGVQICADLRMPEISASLAHRGAEFFVQPTAWVNASREAGGYENIQPAFLVRARAMEFGVPVASCSKSGRETSAMGYVGQSMIVDARGETLAQAPIEGNAVIVADIKPQTPNRIVCDVESCAALRENPFSTGASTGHSVSISAIDQIGRCEAVLKELGARFARMNSAMLASFCHARAHALRGVQVLLVGDMNVDLSIARARSAENRVFMVIFDDASVQLVIEPTGRVVDLRRDGIDSVSIRPVDSDVKMFTPRTPIWSQRRVDSYPFLRH